MRGVSRAVIVAAVALGSLPSPAAADPPSEQRPAEREEAPPPADHGGTRSPAPEFRGAIGRWGIAVGAYWTDFETKARWSDATLGPGTTINLEDDLGLDEDLTRARVDFSLRVGKRSLLELSYLRLRRSASRTLLDREIQWGDQIYRLGAIVESDFDTDVYKISWLYQLVQRPRFRLGLSVGLSTFDLYGGIRGVAQAQGFPGSSSFFEENAEDLLAPVPVLGLGMAAHLTRRLILRAQGQIFSYDDDAWEVDFVDTLAAVEFVAFEHVGFGVGYDYFRIEYAQERYDLNANYTFKGLMSYLRFFY